MNPYLEPHGFLGTGASLLADITFLAYLILIIPAMIVGFGFARRKLFRPYHKITMTAITVVNWVLIIFLMLFAYRYDVADNIGPQTGNTRYLLPTIHGIIGLVAQLLATYVLFRMYREDSQVARAKARGEKDTSKYWFTSAKPIMRLTLTLWLITSILGVFNYLIRYDIIPTFQVSAQVVSPAATPEAFAAPNSTPEVGAPVSTAEVTAQSPVSTEAASVQPPAKTPEAPAETVQPPIVTVEVYIVVTATQSPSPRAPAATPEVKVPVVTEELIEPSSTPHAPAATPEVKSPAQTSEAPVQTPEVKPPVATEELSNTPTATQPPTRAIRPLVATPEVLAPVATEEVTAATNTPTSTPTCVITPTVRPPIATEDLSEFTNTPTATSTPNCLAKPTPTPTSTPTCVITPTVRPPLATEDLSEFTNTPTATSTPSCSTLPTVRAPAVTPEVSATATGTPLG